MEQENFGEEIKELKVNGKIKKRSKLMTLSPYLNAEGLLRVGGRIQAADISVDYKASNNHP